MNKCKRCLRLSALNDELDDILTQTINNIQLIFTCRKSIKL